MFSELFLLLGGKQVLDQSFVGQSPMELVSSSRKYNPLLSGSDFLLNLLA